MLTADDENEEEEIQKICLDYLPLVLVRMILNYKMLLLEGKFVRHIHCSNPYNGTMDDNYLYLTDRKKIGSISRYSLPTLQFVDILLEDSLVWPAGLDLFQNELYIYDEQYIQVFDLTKMIFLRKWKPGNGGSLKNLKIYESKIYIASVHEVIISDLFGICLQRIGQIGSGQEEFYFAEGLDLDESFLYVTDFNHRVQVLHRNTGKYSHQWGQIGSKDGDLRYPYSIFVDPDGYAYVGDDVGVQIFTKRGSFIRRLGKIEPGNGEGEFDTVTGMFISGGCLYVCDIGNDRIQIWK